MLTRRSHKDQVTVAEAAWCMKVAASNFSYNSCEDLPDLFRFMFPALVLFSWTQQGFIRDVTRFGTTFSRTRKPFTFQFDETATVQNQKQTYLSDFGLRKKERF